MAASGRDRTENKAPSVAFQTRVSNLLRDSFPPSSSSLWASSKCAFSLLVLEGSNLSAMTYSCNSANLDSNLFVNSLETLKDQTAKQEFSYARSECQGVST